MSKPDGNARPVTVRPLAEADLDAADRIMRLAFGTFIGLPEPERFLGDADYVRHRYHLDPTAAFALELNGEVIGSNFATRWGSVGFFGPLTVHPDHWDAGYGTLLMPPVMNCFAESGTVLAGLFTFPHSAKHIGLYQKYDFWPQYLTAVMSRPVTATASRIAGTTFAALDPGQQKTVLAACRRLTDAIYPGLDITRDLIASVAHGFGDLVLVWRDTALAAFALCQHGAGTQAGSGTCYIKFAAVRPTEHALSDFDSLVDACTNYAAELALKRLELGVNTARSTAYRRLLGLRFRTDVLGVAMLRGPDRGYNVADAFVLDDWR
jgi:GNAT superfamily N-acetyltransferase